MKNNEYRVHFKTITPLWFGNPLMKNVAPARASSIIGSLRFWFEVICYFSGITKNKDYETTKDKNEKKKKTILKANLNQKEFQEKLIKTLNGKTTANKQMEEIIMGKIINEVLTDMKIPLPARIFSCTGWQGLIRIKVIEIKKEIKGKFALSPRIGIPKDNRNAPILRNRKCPKISNDNYSVHYFPHPFFYGSFDVVFATDENTAQHILFPLLKFVENYGFLGRAWNSGYSRVKINFEETKKEYDGFVDYAEFANNPVKFDELVERVENEQDMWTDKKNTKGIKIFTCTETQNYQGKNIAGILEELVKKKVYLRRSISDSEKRHQVFGTTNSPAHGSKILPWIYEDGKELKYGFVSIVDILSIGE